MFERGGLGRDERATPGGRVRWARGARDVPWEPPDRCRGAVLQSALSEVRPCEAPFWGRCSRFSVRSARRRGFDTRLRAHRGVKRPGGLPQRTRQASYGRSAREPYRRHAPHERARPHRGGGVVRIRPGVRPGAVSRISSV